MIKKKLISVFAGTSNKSVDRNLKNSPDNQNLAPKDTFWFIPSSHWEGAVFKTREQYLDMGLPHILTALRLLNDFPDYRFTLDQVCYIKPFLERYPEEGDAFRQYIKEGRLQIVGGTDSMPDANIPSGESMVRQMLLGKSFFREKLGVDVTVGWAIDTFGHNAQMPQLLKKAGINSYWFQRGVPNTEVPSEWLWEGIDGTRIPAFYLPKGYGMLGHSPENIDEFTDFMKQRFDSLTQWSSGTERVGVASPDVTNPGERVPVMVKEFNQRSDKPFNLRLGVPSDYEALINKRTDRRVLKGELNPIFQGAYSSRIELKQKLRNVEKLLTSAEKLGVICNLLGKTLNEERVMEAWEPSLFNQAHDLMAGVMMDHVYDDTMRGYDFSTKIGRESVGERLDYLASQVDTTVEGIPLVVFNSLGWERDDVVETMVGFKKGGIVDIQIFDKSNKVIPVEIIEAERYKDGGIKNARIIFIAREIPALGQSVFRVIPLFKPSDINSGRESSEGILENEYYVAKFDLITGAMTSLVLKSNKWEVLEKNGNVVARQFDGGDLWELYENLKGGSNINMSRKQPVPLENKDQFSSEYRGDKGSVHIGPVFSEFKVEHNFGINNTFANTLQGTFATRVRLYAGIPRIDIRTEIMNNEKYVRYQVLFPTTIKNGQIIHEIPFGAIERPDAIEFPVQNWADYSDGKKGLALLNQGLPGNLTSESTMILSLMRSATLMGYGSHRYDRDIEPWMSSLAGLELGKELTFDYALVPHEGDWRQGEVYRHGLEYNNPLLCCKTGSHTGKLPKSWGLLNISENNVVISALKQAKDGSTILRLYEASGKVTPEVTLKSNAKLISANEANLIEDTGKVLKLANNTVQFDMKPFEIKTFKFRFKI